MWIVLSPLAEAEHQQEQANGRTARLGRLALSAWERVALSAALPSPGWRGQMSSL